MAPLAAVSAVSAISHIPHFPSAGVAPTAAPSKINSLVSQYSHTPIMHATPSPTPGHRTPGYQHFKPAEHKTNAPKLPRWQNTPASSSAATPRPTPTPGRGISSSNGTTTGKSSGKDSYTLYKGDGSSWPSVNNWVANFEDMWTSNLPVIKKSCTDGIQQNSDDENSNLKKAIQSAASGSKLDPRFVLAVVMQESKGCVRVKTTKYSVENPGLLQDHEGPGTCNPGTPKATCSQDDIEQMINDGIFGAQAPGKAKGDGYLQVFQQAKSKSKGDAQQYYIASRMYNSGTYVEGKLECGVATHCYASDVANRLTGWVNAPTACQEDAVFAGCPATAST